MPSVVQSLATSYNQVEQGLLARVNRKCIKVEMEQDENLAQLSKKRLNHLSELVENLHEKEKEKLHRAIRFKKRLLSINVTVKSKDER